jgi:enolase
MIKSLKASRIKDSRGDATVNVCINNRFCASAPSGKSVGKYEARPRPVGSVLKDCKKIEKHFFGLKTFRAVDKELEPA